MECLHVFGRSMRRSIALQNIKSFSVHAPSRARIQPPGRRKQFITSRFTRSLTTTSSQPQEQTSSTNPPQSQPQPSPSSTAPRPSQWDTITQSQRPHGTNPSTSREAREEREQRLKGVVDMLDIISTRKVGAKTGVSGDLLATIDNKNARITHDSLNSIHLRLTPMLGRTLPVEPGPGLDLQAAFRVLEMRCMQNNVRSDHYKQQNHVRRGQKRKELRSKRWRALFREGFLREVGRIRRMKGQGW